MMTFMPVRPEVWKEHPSKSAARTRAQRLFQLPEFCEHCKTAKAIERHHLDDDPANNDASNVLAVCRRCHMELDGRLAILAAYAPPPKPPQKCVECGKFSTGKYLRRGLCHACNERKRRREKRST